MFILAQILSLLGMILNIIAVQLKTKKQILLTVVVSNILFIVSYLLLGANIGALSCAITAIEIVINTVLENQGKRTPESLIIAYLIIVTLIGIFTFHEFTDLLPVIAAIFFIFSLPQTKEKNIRLLFLGNSIFWGIYDFIVSAYLAGFADIFTIMSTLIAIFRYDIKK